MNIRRPPERESTQERAMKRTFIMVLDSFGIGASADAKKFGDEGADTLGHIAEACARGEATWAVAAR